MSLSRKTRRNNVNLRNFWNMREIFFCLKKKPGRYGIRDIHYCKYNYNLDKLEKHDRLE